LRVKILQGYPFKGYNSKRGAKKMKRQKSDSKVRDRVFRRLFSEKKRAIELCNALEGTNYSPDTDAVICNLEDSLLRRYNDAAIGIESELLLFSEHQSTLNPNMPLRMLSFAAAAYDLWFVNSKEILKNRLYKIPTPKFYVLYNGERKLKHDVLKLSDAYKLKAGEFSLELTAKVLDVNYDSGCAALEKSPSLKGYAYLVALIRRYQENGFSLDKAIKTAIEQCMNENVLADFLQENYEEVANMLLREYRMEDELEARMEEGEEIGMEKGIIGSARKFLAAGLPFEKIVEILELSEDHIKQLEDAAV